jgi:hypothetical protein
MFSADNLRSVATERRELTTVAFDQAINDHILAIGCSCPQRTFELFSVVIHAAFRQARSLRAMMLRVLTVRL